MKKKLFGYICAVLLACLLTVPAAIPAYAEQEDYGPGYVNTIAPKDAETTVDAGNAAKGESLGMFTTTGYCNCSKCSGGHNLTYSGAVPKAAHTLSADLSRFPVGTKLVIDDIVYTVEDMGSEVNGNLVDIYYASHEEALIHGRRTQEVFAVTEENSN